MDRKVNDKNDILKINVWQENSTGVFFFSATEKEAAIGIFADYGLTGHRIGEKQSALRVPTL